MGRARARSRRRQRQARLHDGSRIASSTASERSPVPGTLPQTSALRRGISPRFAHEPRPVDRDTPTTILSKPCRQATELPDIFPGHQSAPSARESRFAGQAPSLSAEVFPSATHRLKAGTLLPATVALKARRVVHKGRSLTGSFVGALAKPRRRSGSSRPKIRKRAVDRQDSPRLHRWPGVNLAVIPDPDVVRPRAGVYAPRRRPLPACPRRALLHARHLAASSSPRGRSGSSARASLLRPPSGHDSAAQRELESRRRAGVPSGAARVGLRAPRPRAPARCVRIRGPGSTR